MRRLPLLTISLLIVSGVIGCSRAGMPRCDKQQEYQTVGSIDAVEVPAGMNQPERSGSLEIPDLSPDARARAPGDPCLEAPPDYFTKKPGQT